MDKQQRKAALKQWKHAERADVLARRLPMRVLNLLLASWLVLATGGCRQPPVDSKQISPYGLSDQEIKGWQEIKAELGWIGPDPAFSTLKFSSSRDALATTKAVPAFSWGLSRMHGVDSLVNRPIPNVSFGLRLYGFFDRPWPDEDNEELKRVAGMKNLAALILKETNVNDKGMAHLGALKLTHLDLYKTKVTDAGLKNLAEMKSLICLDLYGTQVTDRGMEHLAGLTSLTYLGLPSDLSDEGFKHLAALTELNALSTRSRKLTDAGLKHLAKMTKLKTLDMHEAVITEEGLKELVSLKSLSELNISYEVISDRGLEILLEIQLLHTLPQAKATKGPTPTRTEEITDLRIGSAKVTDAAIKHLTVLSNLMELDLNGARVTDASVTHLAGFKKLHRLDLWDTQVTAEGVRDLRRALPNCHIVTSVRTSPE